MAELPRAQRSVARVHVELFLVAGLSLYVEMFLVRWLGAEVRLAAYFRGLVLLAAFLGLGIGYALQRRNVPMWTCAAALLALAGLSHPDLVVAGFSPRDTLRFITPYNLLWQESIESESWTRSVAWLCAAAYFGLTAAAMVSMGGRLGQLFMETPHRARAYAWDLAGSIIGVGVFALLSFMEVTPAGWALLAVTGLAVASRGRFKDVTAALGLGAGALWFMVHVPPGAEEVFFSPYQMISTRGERVRNAEGAINGRVRVDVNGVFYQGMLDQSVNALPGRTAETRVARDADPYNLVYTAAPSPGRVLILGAGSGNDAAAALRGGAGHVDAVELDPVIARLGAEHHPERPYSDPRVTLHVTDARAFLTRSREKYDLVVLGLLDSHALNGTRGNTSLDSFVYTREGLRSAMSHVAKDGLLVLSFQAFAPWICSRLKTTLADVSGGPVWGVVNRMPAGLGGQFVPHGWGVTLVAGNLARLNDGLSQRPDVQADVTPRLVQGCDEAVEPTTDDWPYVYLEERGLPPLWPPLTLMVAVLALLAWWFTRGAAGTGDPSFFLLGGAFLFVELHTVSRCALLFGSTWLVSAAAVAGVLLAVCVGNLVAVKTRVGVPVAAAVLLVGLVTNALVPLEWLLVDPIPLRVVVAGTVLGWPLAGASVIFVRFFAATERPDAALSINLLGAVAGGLLEAVTYVFGLRSAGLVACALYVVALLVAREPALRGLLRRSGPPPATGA